MGPVTIFDSTLRDGAQGTGVAFSLEDKLQAVRLLDQVGVQYVEAGNPGSNPKDAEFFQRAASLPLKNAKLVSFGSTRRKNIPAWEDANLAAVLAAGGTIILPKQAGNGVTFALALRPFAPDWRWQDA